MSREDEDRLASHRRVWLQRPELRDAYGELFERLLGPVEGLSPVFEIGAGPGFLKERRPDLVASDVLAGGTIDVRCDACRLPVRDAGLGGIVMVDVLHHLPSPLSLLREAARALRVGGRMAAIEPWISPFSYPIYRWLHHEECRLGVDLDRPFDASRKSPWEGNEAIPFAMHRGGRASCGALRLTRVEPFLALPYLSTLGFRRERPLPPGLLALARRIEHGLGRAGRWGATRALLVWEKH